VLGERPCHRRRAGCGVGDVELDGERRRRDGAPHARERLGVEVGEHRPRASPGELGRRGRADPTRASGDEDDLLA